MIWLSKNTHDQYRLLDINMIKYTLFLSVSYEGRKMYRFWGKPKAEKEQRKVFIVRAVCPEWMIWYHSERAREIAKEQEIGLLPLDIREDIVYLTNNINIQMPPGKVLIASNGHDDNFMTVQVIKDKLAGHEMEYLGCNVYAQCTEPKLNKWLNKFLSNMKAFTSNNIVVVVDQGTFDRWYSQLHMQEKPHSEPCMLVSNGSKGLLSVA